MTPTESCPKCGCERSPEDVECRRCGVVFWKLERAMEGRPGLEPGTGADRVEGATGHGPSSARRFPVARAALLGLVGLVLLVWLLRASNPEARRIAKIAGFARDHALDLPGRYESDEFIRQSVCEEGCFFEMELSEDFVITSIAFDSQHRLRTRSRIEWIHPSHIEATQTLRDFDEREPLLLESRVVFEDRSVSIRSTSRFGTSCVRDDTKISYTNDRITPLTREAGTLHLDPGTNTLVARFRYGIPESSNVRISKDEFVDECTLPANLCEEFHTKDMGPQFDEFSILRDAKCTFDLSVWPLVAKMYAYPVDIFESIIAGRKESSVHLTDASELFLTVAERHLLGLDIAVRADGSVHASIESGTIEHELYKVPDGVSGAGASPAPEA